VLTETMGAGHADTAGNSTADNVGTFPSDGAVHDGTTQPILDTSQGQDSALGGQDAHPLEFAGSEIQPTVSGSAVILQEPSEGSTHGPTNWVSHPSAIGYRRQGTPSGSSGGASASMAAVTPEMDSGMSDGTTGQELARIGSFYTGAEENPTSAQSAPTPRAEQDVTSLNPGDSDGGGSSSPPPPPTDPTPGPQVAQPGSQQDANAGSGAAGSNPTPQPGGYFGGAWNPANLLRWAYTGNPNSPDEYYNAGLAPAGEVYNERKGAAHGVLSVASGVPGVGMLPAGVNAVLYEAEGEHGKAAVSVGEGAAAGMFGWFNKARKAKQLAEAERLAAEAKAGGTAARAGETAAAAPNGKAFTVDPRVVGQLSDPRMGQLAGSISPDRLHELVNNPAARHFFDSRTGNINVIQEVEGKLLRITVAGDKFKVISVGPIQERNVRNLVANGGFVPIGATP
jgi:hypothetical protein